MERILRPVTTRQGLQCGRPQPATRDAPIGRGPGISAASFGPGDRLAIRPPRAPIMPVILSSMSSRAYPILRERVGRARHDPKRLSACGIS